MADPGALWGPKEPVPGALAHAAASARAVELAAAVPFPARTLGQATSASLAEAGAGRDAGFNGGDQAAAGAWQGGASSRQLSSLSRPDGVGRGGAGRGLSREDEDLISEMLQEEEDEGGGWGGAVAECAARQSPASYDDIYIETILPEE